MTTLASFTVKYGKRRCNQCGQLFQATQSQMPSCDNCGAENWAGHGPKCPAVGTQNFCELHGLPLS